MYGKDWAKFHVRLFDSSDSPGPGGKPPRSRTSRLPNRYVSAIRRHLYCGGVTGALIGMGIPEYEAKRYEGRLQKGGILLSTHCNTSQEIKRAKGIMQRTGAEDISSTGESSVDTKNVEANRAANR